MRLKRLVIACLVLTGCGTFESRELEVCGNGLLESDNGEDCDGADGCISAEDDEAHGCLWSCADDACPDGFACGDDQVCRRPAYEFEESSPLIDDPANWIDLRDLDELTLAEFQRTNVR